MLDCGAVAEGAGRRSRSGSRRKRGAVGGPRASQSAAADHRRPNRPKERRGGGRQAPARPGGGGEGRGRGRAGDDHRRADSPDRAGASVRPRGSGRDEDGGASAGTAGAVNQSNPGSTGSDPGEEGGGQPSGWKADGERRPEARGEQQQPKQVGAGAKKDGGEEEPVAEAAALSKDAAFLKADEDTEGGRGAMLFTEFVEALTRLCLKRYGPRAGARGGGGAAPLGVGWKSSSATWRSSFEPKHLARRSLNVRGGVERVAGGPYLRVYVANGARACRKATEVPHNKQ